MSVRFDIAASRHLSRSTTLLAKDFRACMQFLMSGTFPKNAMTALVSDGLILRLSAYGTNAIHLVAEFRWRNALLPKRRMPGMGNADPSVLLIDDDPEFRDSVARLLRTVGLHTREFSSVPDFLKADPPDGPTCLILDVRMPGRSGLELQRELAAANRQVPIIFMTAHADVPMTVQAMKGGAIEFLTKPFRDQDLLDAVEAGLARDRARRESERALAVLRERYDMLSSRERDIMLHVVAGRLNKQIANDIGIAESTVKVHRTNLMRKMKARSLPELSRMADMLNVRLPRP